jgi:hypothetical protein
MKTKSVVLLSGTIEGWCYRCTVQIIKNGRFKGKGQNFTTRNSKEERESHVEKITIRKKDQNWVRQNIPSSIWWYTENHHDWKDGGRLYLLTEAEHILRHRREK